MKRHTLLISSPTLSEGNTHIITQQLINLIYFFMYYFYTLLYKCMVIIISIVFPACVAIDVKADNHHDSI